MSFVNTIKFLGAAGTVTGSKHLISAYGKKIMLDCGLFQGIKKLRLLNWQELPVKAAEIDFVLLSHGHLDHCGYLPCLVKAGFKGQIIATGPTLQIAQIILQDSAKIQEEDAKHAEEGGYSRHKKPQPLYNLADVERTINLFQEQEEGQWLSLAPELRVRFNYNAHIIGSTFIELELDKKTLIFSGDLGRDEDILLYPPKKPVKADIVLIESTYGERMHPSEYQELLISVIKKTARKKGTIIIPSFAVERSQALMYLLWKWKKQGLIPDLPVYMDSPMGNKVLEVFLKNMKWHKLSNNDCQNLFDNITLLTSLKQSFRNVENPEAKIVIAGGGMASGGRVLNYLSKYLGDKKAAIVLVGFQAEGTRGRLLLDGADKLKIHGKYYQVRARIENIKGLSAHADQEGLVNWLSELKQAPVKIFIIHGEPQAADTLRVKIKDTYGWDCQVPDLNEEFPL